MTGAASALLETFAGYFVVQLSPTSFVLDLEFGDDFVGLDDSGSLCNHVSIELTFMKPKSGWRSK